jgi:hypothetical protein
MAETQGPDGDAFPPVARTHDAEGVQRLRPAV